jgi:hypothetical protein
MLFLSGRRPFFTFGIGVAAYAVASAGAVVVTGYVLWQASVAVFDGLEIDLGAPARVAIATAGDKRAVEVAAQAALHREAAMSPLADRGYGSGGGLRSRMREFGASNRNPYVSYGYQQRRDEWGFEEERPRPVITFRTMCVRLCDGYYFPISFAVTPDRLDRDRNVCASRCGAQGRLFVHPSLEPSADEMVDLQGRPYRNLPTAFLYRTQYVADCKCQPEPWETASLERHRAYALAAAAKKGNKDAAKELRSLQAKMKEDAKTAGRPAPSSVVGVGGAPNAAAAARQAEIAKREDGSIMLLGGGPDTKGKSNRAAMPTKSGGDPDWIRRALDAGSGR